MLRRAIKISIVIILTFSFTTSKAQRTFHIDKIYLDSIFFDKYKSFIVSKEFDINFIGRKIPTAKRFTPDTTQITVTEKAIKTQYFNARVKQLDSQWTRMKANKESYDWDLAVKQHNASRHKMLKNFKAQQKNDLDNYDRYFYGFLNDLDELIILIRFDPHKIKYYTISGEQLLRNLPIMTFNTKTGILFLSGWE